MSADIAHELKRHDGDELEQARSRTLRARIVLALGPAAMVGGIVWAVLQPWRLTLLHPHGQGFWWLVSEAPLYPILVGLRLPARDRTGRRRRPGSGRGRAVIAGILPHPEMVHWWFATGFLMLGLLLLAEALVGPEVWRRRPWRAYLWPSLAFGMGVLMWPVMAFYTNSAIHMVAHGSWAEVLMLAGAAELGLARGKLHSPYWRLTSSLALIVSGTAFIVHEQNHWLFSRAAFLHHALGWTALVCAVFPLVLAFRPRSIAAASGFAMFFVTLAVLLYCDRDVAPIFGHLSQFAGPMHR